MAIRQKWYPRKKPTLQIKILESIGEKGKLSKRKAQQEFKCEYPTVSDAFKVLEQERELIVKIQKFHSAGYSSPEIFYELTEKGLRALIDQGMSPLEFWDAFIQFCKFNVKKLTFERFQELYKYFEDKHLGYSPQESYFFQSRFLDKVFEKWLKANGKMEEDGTVLHYKDSFRVNITVSQRILEYLAINGACTVEQISSEINKSERLMREILPGVSLEDLVERKEVEKVYGPADKSQEVRKILDEYTLSRDQLDLLLDELREMDNSNGYINLIYHNLLIEENGKYELSLFGLAIVLYILDYAYYLDKSTGLCETLPMYLIRYKDPDKPHLSQEDLMCYYDEMAANYKNKLPLIFGKWNALKNDLHGGGSGSLRQVFNCLFNTEMREDITTAPAIIGGIKEYYENVQALARHHGSKLEAVYKDLQQILEDKQEEYQDNDDLKKLFFEKHNEIRDEFMFTDIDRFMHNLHEKLQEYPDVIKTIVKHLELIYANELSFLLYLIVGKDYVWIGGTGIRFVELVDRSDVTYDQLPSGTLTHILEWEKDIKASYSKWINDSMIYEKLVLDIISEYNNAIGRNR